MLDELTTMLQQTGKRRAATCQLWHVDLSRPEPGRRGDQRRQLHLYGAMIVKLAPASFRPSPSSADWRPSPRPDLPLLWLPRAVTVKAGPQAR
jgi:hypothetical protein